MLCLGTVFAVQAMTLGELRGEALIGRALDLRLPIQPGAGEQLSEACVSADIFYGEAQQNAPRISLQGDQLRLQLAEPVNEPIVKVQIRTVCGVNQIRNYVLLADLPSAVGTQASFAAPAAMDSAGQGSTIRAPAASVMPSNAKTVVTKSGLTPQRKVAPAVVKAKKSGKKAKTKATTSKRAPDRKAPGKQAAKPVLKLDPMEVLSDRVDNLELNMPFKPAEDALLQSKQIAQLQAELKGMRDLAAKNDSNLVSLRSQLQQAQSQLQLTPFLYGLIAILVSAVAVLVWLWRGQKKLTASWWQHPADDDPKDFSQPEVAPPLPVPTPATNLPRPTTDKPVARSPGLNSTMGLQTRKAEVIATVPSAPPATVTATTLRLNPDATQEVRQQADFFVSLGQADQAIRILKQNLDASNQPNPMICMDLLRLYHQAGQSAEFGLLREVCHQNFHVQLPELASFQQEGRSLVSYPEVLTALTRLWPGEPVLAFMDNCIFLKNAANLQNRFDLAAFRELLLLHSMAEDLLFPVAVPGVAVNKQQVEVSRADAMTLDFVLPEDPPPTRY